MPALTRFDEAAEIVRGEREGTSRQDGPEGHDQALTKCAASLVARQLAEDERDATRVQMQMQMQMQQPQMQMQQPQQPMQQQMQMQPSPPMAMAQAVAPPVMPPTPRSR